MAEPIVAEAVLAEEPIVEEVPAAGHKVPFEGQLVTKGLA